jgi:hypothetical protein
MNFGLEKIVTGGNTGCDRAGLIAAERLGLKTGGFLPKGLKTDDDKGEEVMKRFNLLESSGGYRQRDMDTADMCDSLIAFLLNEPNTGRGTTGTINYVACGKHEFTHSLVAPSKGYLIIKTQKPVLVLWDAHIDANKELIISQIRDFLINFRLKSIMISGPVENTKSGIERRVTDILVQALQII